MKFWLIAAGTVLAMCGPAQAVNTHNRTTGCNNGTVLRVGAAHNCRYTFMATADPQRFTALGQSWRGYRSRWVTTQANPSLCDGCPTHTVDPPVAEGERPFLAYSWADSCVFHGRYGALRVVERSCDGRLLVKVRSVGAPTPVRFEWTSAR